MNPSQIADIIYPLTKDDEKCGFRKAKKLRARAELITEINNYMENPYNNLPRYEAPPPPVKKQKEVLPELGTKERIKLFESDQEKYGTEVAVKNLIYQVAADILKTIGIHHIKTE